MAILISSARLGSLESPATFLPKPTNKSVFVEVSTSDVQTPTVEDSDGECVRTVVIDTL